MAPLGGRWPELTAFVIVLLAVRRLPVVLALRRWTGFSRRDSAFLGWFGPVGVASVFYLAMSRSEGVDDPVLWAAGTLAVTISTVVYGMTAAPGRVLYKRRAERTAAEHDL